MKLSRNVKLLAYVSLFNDIASEATLRLLPLFLSQVLGASTAVIGLIEGIGESTATLMKLFSGWISDRIPRRKPLVVAGYALSGLARPLLFFANHWGWVLFVRFSDRFAKGIRAPARDALIADESERGKRGHSFGLNRAMDTLGAFLGLAAAYFITKQSTAALTRPVYDKIVLLTIVPSIIAVGLVAFAIKEKAHHLASKGRTKLKHLPSAFWQYMAIVTLFTLANSSDAFLVLKASHTKAGVPFVLICLMALNFTSAALAVPAGKLSDRIGRKSVIIMGWFVYAIAYAGFGLCGRHPRPLVVVALFLIYGAFYGLSEGVEKSYVADLVPPETRGSAYGIFSVAVGIMNFPASLVFGLMLQKWGDAPSFLAAATLALTCSALLALSSRRWRSRF